MEKKTRKKSKVVNRTYIVIGTVVILFILSMGITFYMMTPKHKINDEVDKYKYEQQEDIKKDNDNILFKIGNKYINEYGYITDISNSSAIQVQGVNIQSNQEQMESSIFEKLLKLYNTLKNNDLTIKVSKIDITNIDDVKVYMDSENKIIQIGNFENLSTKFVYAKDIMKQEKGKTGTIFVKDTSKTYFRENV